VSDGGIDSRADVMAAALRVDAADAAARQAHALLLPRVAVEGGYEWNGATWSDRAAAWFVGVRAALSLSLGGAEAARAKAAAHAVERARAQKASVERAAQVDVVAARARLEAARARQDIAAGSLTQARESARIIRERFEAGLAGVTDVLRASDAVLTAESLQITSHVDVLVATVMLDRALGHTPGSAGRQVSP
jgi:outer membrane protein TolC